MKTAIAIIYFILFGFVWPHWIGGRTRGAGTVACLAAPWAAYWFGWWLR